MNGKYIPPTVLQPPKPVQKTDDKENKGPRMIELSTNLVFFFDF